MHLDRLADEPERLQMNSGQRSVAMLARQGRQG